MTLDLKLENIGYSQAGETWLDDIDLTFEAGMSVLIGPTLAGKSTLMRVIAGLTRPTSGKVIVGGSDVTTTSVRARSVAFVYQQFVNYPSFSVYDNIASPLIVDGTPSREVRARVLEVADLMDIGTMLNRKPAELSGGQQQRVAIARALARRADVVLLDEPLANLDYKLREQFRHELATIFKDLESVVIYSTTEPEEALGFARETVVIDAGRIQQTGDPVELYHRPYNLAVAHAMSDPPINLVEAEVSADGIRFLGTSARATDGNIGDRVLLGIRPHQVMVATDGDHIRFPADVRVAEVTGSFTYLHTTVAGDAHFVAQIEGAHEEFEVGERIELALLPEPVVAFDPGSGKLLSRLTLGRPDG